MTRKPILALAAIALTTVSLGLAACGSDSSDSAAAPATTTDAPAATTAPATPATTAPADTAPAASGTTVDVAADPGGSLAFTEKTLTAAAGPVTLNLTNDSPVPHNIAVKGGDVDSPPSDTIQGGDSAEITVDLPAGTYEYYCEVPGHEAAGMKGEITVK